MVTSVSKREEKLSTAPSAITVLSQEDIRRSGATSIPEALRMVPGLFVARIDANKWVVSARGFSDQFSNKLLVLIDGRSVYTPLFSGVYWDVQDVLLEDVERIEVIRGPGATLWGSNAVNGVINIITKKAKDTQGGLISAQTGSEEDILGVRYGWQLPSGAYVRTWAKLREIDSFKDEFDRNWNDDWSMERAGFRLDWDMTDEDSLTLQGDLYNGDLNEVDLLRFLERPFVREVEERSDVSGGDLLLRYQRKLSDTETLTLQMYYDRTERTVSDLYEESRDTFDLDFTHELALGSCHEVIWGFGYRYTSDEFQSSFNASVFPAERKDDLWSAFVQDTIELAPDRLELTLGSKFEYNDYTGFEAQPSARLAYTSEEGHTTWASVSRAVRTPSRIESDGNLVLQSVENPMDPGGPPILGALVGNDDYESEEVIAYELGHRIHVNQCLSFDLAGFVNAYDNLRNFEPGDFFLSDDPPPPHLVMPFFFDNKMDGHVYGVEVSSEIRVTDHWRLVAGYTFIRPQMHLDSDSGDPFSQSDGEDLFPTNQFHIRSYLDLPCGWEFDTGLYAVEHIRQSDVPGYVRADTRLGWHATPNLELSFGLQNLFDDRHPEFGNTLFTQPSEVQHAVYGKVVYRF